MKFFRAFQVLIRQESIFGAIFTFLTRFQVLYLINSRVPRCRVRTIRSLSRLKPLHKCSFESRKPDYSQALIRQTSAGPDGNQVFNIRNEYRVSYLLLDIRLPEQPLPKRHVSDNSLHPKPFFF